MDHPTDVKSALNTYIQYKYINIFIYDINLLTKRSQTRHDCCMQHTTLYCYSWLVHNSHPIFLEEFSKWTDIWACRGSWQWLIDDDFHVIEMYHFQLELKMIHICIQTELLNIYYFLLISYLRQSGWWQNNKCSQASLCICKPWKLKL